MALSPNIVSSNGNTVSWSILVRNTHPITNENVQVALVVPPGLSVNLGQSYTSDGSVLTETNWAIGDMPANSVRNAVIMLTVDDVKAGPFTLSAVVSGTIAEINMQDNVLQETLATQCPCCTSTFIEKFKVDNLEGATNTFSLPSAFANIPNANIDVWVTGQKIYHQPPDAGALQWDKTLGSVNLTLSATINETDVLEVWGWKC